MLEIDGRNCNVSSWFTANWKDISNKEKLVEERSAATQNLNNAGGTLEWVLQSEPLNGNFRYLSAWSIAALWAGFWTCGIWEVQ